jgi:hypothetical protein
LNSKHILTHRISKLLEILAFPRWTLGLLAPLLLAWSGTAAAGAPPPTIRLFPTTVVENVKESSQVAKDMETSLQDVIAQLEQQWDLYQESKCEGNEGDGGCAHIAQQMGDKYLEMLSLMDEQLPRIEHSVQATVDSLENRLRQELGQKLTARDLQEILLEAPPQSQLSSPKRTVHRRSSHRLSERFRQYYRLVLQAGAQAGASDSVALAAADIYLDSTEVLELLRLTQNEINRAQLMIELRNQFGAVTPEMHEVVTGVKKILLGEENETSTPYEASPPTTAFPEEYRSPLEF